MHCPPAQVKLVVHKYRSSVNHINVAAALVHTAQLVGMGVQQLPQHESIQVEAFSNDLLQLSQVCAPCAGREGGPLGCTMQMAPGMTRGLSWRACAATPSPMHLSSWHQ